MDNLLLKKIRDKKNGIHSDNIEKSIVEFDYDGNYLNKAFMDEYQDNIVEYVYNVIDKCKELTYALECVGAMYGVPSSNIMASTINDNGIVVSGDNIVAPCGLSAANNKKAIIRAISAVLDNKSKCIDDKLDEHHKKEHHKHTRATFTPDPNKGKVIGRYFDAENNEIIVYDTGIVDFKKTPAAMEKINELKLKGMIPDYNFDVLQSSCCNKKSYFGELDDITKGVDMLVEEDDMTDASSVDTSSTDTSDVTVDTAGSDSVDDSSSETISTNDIASAINESAVYVELCSIFGGTHNLGYDLMTMQGFDFLKPTIVEESAKDKKKTSGSEKLKPDDIEWMRFDNKHIVNAVKKINNWIEESDAKDIDDIDFAKLYESSDFKEAIDELSAQFDAKIEVEFKEDKDGDINVYTTCDDITDKNKLKKVCLSKSKGFQFNGNPIHIVILGEKVMKKLTIGDDISLCGQHIISILLHEIFHNAMWSWKVHDTEFNASLTLTLQLASSIKSASKRRKIISNYINMLDELYGMKLNAISKKAIVKRMTMMTAISNIDRKKLATKEANIYKNKAGEENDKISPDEDVEELIDAYTNYMKKFNKSLNIKNDLLKILIGVLGIGGGIAIGYTLKKDADDNSSKGPMIGAFALGLAGAGLTVTGVFSMVENLIWKSLKKNYENSKDLEEQWCDLCSAIYQLPVSFKLMTPNDNEYTDKDISSEIIHKFNKIDIDIHKLILDCHPSGSERNWQSVNIAKELLKEEKYLSPETKKYLEWIVEAYKTTGDNKDIEDIYNTSVFSPETAQKLDDHVNHLIEITGMTVTESFKY